ncbi:MAG: SEC-C metal-binding domain-containing protein, partial [Candidatus Eisenbacteria bacterium]
MNIGRNDHCPCGSGLKYKQCCQGKLRLNLRARRGWMLAALGLAVAAVITWGLWRSPSAPRGTGTRGAGATAQPWAYDSVSKRHFDPGHGHWHDGPPPPAEARGTTTAPHASSA